MDNEKKTKNLELLSEGKIIITKLLNCQMN